MASTGSHAAARRAIDALTTLNTVRERGTAPTPQERVTLLDWPGWGPLAPAFDPQPEGTWTTVADRLTDLLDDDAHNDASECLDTSFYTPPLVVDSVYRILAAAGFRGGRVLEPGCGAGTFMERTPPGWDLDVVGVERDVTSARFAQALHPEARILHSRLEHAALAGRFDAVVGNVPFSSQTVWDSASEIHASLHDYFILRGLDALREGGYLVAVTSRFSLDATDDRPLLARAGEVADFVGAVRLPGAAFKSQGTTVVTDIVVLRKNTMRPREGWRAPRGGGRTHTYVTGPDRDAVPVTAYWAEHPEHVAGRMVATGHFRNPLGVESAAVEEDVTAAVDALCEVVRDVPMFDAAPAPLDASEFEDAQGRKEGSFHEIDGVVYRVEAGALVEVLRPSRELRALIVLRDLAARLLEAESDPDRPDALLEPDRARAREAYEEYVRQWGPLNRGTLHEGAVDPETGMARLSWRRPSLGGFRRDPDYVKVIALEHYDQDTGEASPAPILLRRVNRAPVRVERVETPAAALAVSLGESASVDMERIAGLLDLPDVHTAAAALGDLVFMDPEDAGRWVPAREYLTGDIPTRLRAARAAARQDPRFERNVTALEASMPAPLGPLDIVMRLGNPCLQVSDVQDFMREVLGASPTVERCAVTASWKVADTYTRTTAASSTYGTPALSAFRLVEYALTGRAPVVYDDVTGPDGKVRKVRNADQTIAAQEKVNALQDRFSQWVWEDPKRAERLSAEYNRRFNSHVARRADGGHLIFPGLATDVTPYPWQRDIVDLATSTPAVLCGHPVGAGKTLSMALLAMTLKRFGMANKPLIVVPNHLLEQIAREMQQAFPLGRFLIAGKDDLAGEARRLFAARCATGEWDAVVMTHTGFTSLPVAPATEIEWVEEQKDAYRDHLRSDAGNYFGSKEIARRLRSLEARLERLRDDARTDQSTVLFEHLGVDYIAVDEAHYFKRLDVASRAEGFSMGASKRATDLLLKSQTIAARKPGMPHLALFTGTPWTNSLAETFVWQKFTQPDVLAAAGVAEFDAWAAVFVKRETVIEVAPDGSGFRTTTRPTRMHNLPELRWMLGRVSDILTADQIGLERPERRTVSLSVEQGEEQAAYVADLVERAEELRKRSGGRTGRDNMLAICGDGRRAALDPHLVGVAEDSPKIARLADRVADIYHATREQRYIGSAVPGALQVVFCDQGTPGARGAQTYGRIRDALVERGVPAARVRFVHEATNDKARAAMFAACRDGSVSVIIGSTETMGTGTNIQTRLVAIHHADAPWRPADVEQRDGRGLRPGNLNAEVEIARYVTEGTFDAYMWQTLERKALGFAAMYATDPTLREVDDIGEVAPSYTQMKALATGNPLLLEQAEAAAAVKRLRTLRAVDRQTLVGNRRWLADLERELAQARARQTRLAEAAELLGDEEPAETLALLAMVTDARRILRQMRSLYSPKWSVSARWRGLTVRVNVSPAWGEAEVQVLRGVTVLDAVEFRPREVGRAREERALLFVHDLLTRWAEGLPATRERVSAEIPVLESKISDVRRFVDEYAFPQAEELQRAEADLERIEALIALEAAPEEAPTAAAAAAA